MIASQWPALAVEVAALCELFQVSEEALPHVAVASLPDRYESLVHELCLLRDELRGPINTLVLASDKEQAAGALMAVRRAFQGSVTA